MHNPQHYAEHTIIGHARSSQIPRPHHQQEVDCFCTRFSLCTSEGLQLPWILLFITDVYYSEQLWFLLTWTWGGGALDPSGL